MSPVPSDEELMAFLDENPTKATKRDLARAFGLKGADRIELKAQLRRLRYDGRLQKDGGDFRKTEGLPPVFPAVIARIDDDGDLIVRPRLNTASDNQPEFVLTEGGRGKALGKASTGDLALVRITSPAEDGELGQVKLIKLIGRAQTRHIGVLRVGKRGAAHLEPVDRKAQELTIPEHLIGEAQDGDLVAVTKMPGNRHARDAKVEQVYGQLWSERAISQIAILRHDLPDAFPMEVVDESEALPLAAMSEREDWRDLPLITIDPKDAKDHDDAVYAEADTDPNNQGGFILTVAIADVAFYVRQGTQLDAEARKRGNSVYFPDRVVPMLPERLSTDLCSLREGEERPALAIRMVFSADGTKRSHALHRVWIKLHAGLAYEAAQAAIDGEAPPEGIPPCPADILQTVLTPLWDAYSRLTKARAKRSPLELNLPETALRLGPDGRVDSVHVPERLDAHKLIEECMIQANVAAAELLEAKKAHPLYRVHDAPSKAKFEALKEFLKSINVSLTGHSALTPRHFNGILSKAATSPNAPLINEMVLRSQAQAEYTPENIGHFGLNLRRYAHFTSPIRRYADLIVHRALLRAYRLEIDGDGSAPEFEVLERIGQHISSTERRAMSAERETRDRLIAVYLEDKIGATFEGRVTGVVGAGLFVRLDETGADGFVPAGSLGDEYFAYREDRQALIGTSTGSMFQLGDEVKVRLEEAAPLAGSLRFQMLSRPKRGGKGSLDASRGKTKRGGRPKARSSVKPQRKSARTKSSATSLAESEAATAKKRSRKARGR